MRTWTGADLPALISVVDAAFPSENLTADEVLSACFEGPDPSIVLGLPDGEGAVAVVACPSEEGPLASVVLLGVAPGARGEGRGRRLLQAAEEWAFDGALANRLWAGGPAPFLLWPGVDVQWIPALCLLESAGYRDDASVLVLSFPSSYRAATPPHIELRRVVGDDDADLAMRLCSAQWPASIGPVGRAIEHATCFLAVAQAASGEQGAPAGLVCHSVNRTGWVGPIAVTSAQQRRGIGSALLSAVAADLRVAGVREAHVCPGRPAHFFARAAGATTSRVFLRFSRARG